MAMANETGSVQHQTAIQAIQVAWNVVFGGASKSWPVQVHLDWGHGPKRVIGPVRRTMRCECFPLESSCLGVQLKVQGKRHVRLNMTQRPIQWGKITKNILLKFLSL